MNKRYRTQLFLFIFFSMLIGSGSFSFSAEEPALSLKAAIDEALVANPEILAAKKNYEAARARIPQEFSPEDPMLEYNYDEMRAGVPDLMGKPMRSYAVSQRVPFPTKLFLRSAITAKDAKISYAGYKEKERDIIARTKAAYFELWFIEKAVEITKEHEALLEQFSSSTAARYSLGRASQQDVLKAEVELAKIKNSMVLLQEQRGIAQAKLNILLNKDPSLEIKINKDLEAIAITTSSDELMNMARKYRPKLQAFQYAVEKGRLAYILAWNEFLPDISGRFEQMIKDGKAEDWSGMLSVTVPIWSLTKQAPGVGGMKSELDMFKAEYNMIENMVLFDVKDAYLRVESRKKLAEIYETSFVPQAEQTLKASLAGYEANQIDFLNLLDSQRMLLEIKLDYYKTLIELETAKADLEMAVGTDL